LFVHVNTAREVRMEEASGVLWMLQIVVGPIVLGLALAYAAFQWRRRRRLQGESNYTTREVMMLALPVVVGVVVFTALMMIPGSQ
jgi:heme/copper-type cytochrome/quinol oxidase subunit 2